MKKEITKLNKKKLLYVSILDKPYYSICLKQKQSNHWEWKNKNNLYSAFKFVL